MANNSLEIIKVNSFIRGYHVYMTEWELTTGDVYKLMQEPSNIKDSNAITIHCKGEIWREGDPAS